ncbi:DUF6907 domain-containing protein [Streptomyces sp. NPDC059759]|uniref:DUF6907 domain-containing protein n=1 Tax=Streptomyces sp. NPDC059759 TaxID=3346936 RepID=UPI0036641F54
MSTAPRTATVNLLVTKNLEIDEPDWCTGHRIDRAQFKVDISHTGPEHAVEINGFPILVAMLSQAPYAERASAALCLYVEQADFTGSYTPDEVEQLADALVQAAAQLRGLGRGLADLLDGGGQ